jgi:hypothetical protein
LANLVAGDIHPHAVLAGEADAFLASLSTRRLELRSALGSFSFAAHFPDHRLVDQARGQTPSGRLHCRLCGLYGHSTAEQEDLNVLSFERWKWGGVRHVNPLYCWFDLTQFEKASLAAPTQEDHSILARIVEIASGLSPKAKPNELEKRISKVVRSNGSERRALIEILGYCGVLKPAGRCGFLQAFTSSEHRDGLPITPMTGTTQSSGGKAQMALTEMPSIAFSRKLQPWSKTSCHKLHPLKLGAGSLCLQELLTYKLRRIRHCTDQSSTSASVGLTRSSDQL